jgi:hypothetical protein
MKTFISLLYIIIFVKEKAEIMITKTRLKTELESFGEMIDIEELLEKMIFIEKLEARMVLANNGEFVSENDLKLEMETWFK